MVVLAESEASLQSLLKVIYEWCQDWRLKVNESKTKVIHFRNVRKSPTDFVFKYGDSDIEKVTQYKYLGVILDEHLKYDRCVQSLADSSGRALGGIISKFKCLRNVGYDTFTKLYTSGVQPVSEYGAGIWGYHKGKAIDIVQNRAMRYFLGVHKFTPNAAITGDMGWIQPMFSRYLCMIRFWNRLIEMHDDRLTKKVFLYDYEKCCKNWNSEIKDIFVKLDMENIFNERIVCDLNHVKTKIHEIMERNWRQEVNKKAKLRTFKTFKTELQAEPYVKFLTARQHRSLLAQLRCGVLPLRIETGRFARLDVTDRLCEVCNLAQIEDEQHFVMVCPLYENVRTNLYNHVQNQFPEFRIMNQQSKFEFLLKQRWRDLSKYIVQAWNIRKEKLYI